MGSQELTRQRGTSSEGRARAVATVDGGASLRSAAKELGVSRESVRTWVNNARATRIVEPVKVSHARTAREQSLSTGRGLDAWRCGSEM
ncbi:transposase [Methylocystis silviterrae]|uniref:transposase n=1 Tax=Methylocystis silviterrae TaxID=2743612 RepID=UPI0038CBFD2E